nr:hypothetical protein [Burkholderia anthina]
MPPTSAITLLALTFVPTMLVLPPLTIVAVLLSSTCVLFCVAASEFASPRASDIDTETPNPPVPYDTPTLALFDSFVPHVLSVRDRRIYVTARHDREIATRRDLRSRVARHRMLRVVARVPLRRILTTLANRLQINVVVRCEHDIAGRRNNRRVGVQVPTSSIQLKKMFFNTTYTMKLIIAVKQHHQMIFCFRVFGVCPGKLIIITT